MATILLGLAGSVAANENSDKLKASEPISIDDAQAQLIQNTTIAAPMAGVITRLDVRTGDAIGEGGLILSLDDRLAQGELEAAQAAFEAAAMQSRNDVSVRYAQRTMQVKRRELEQSNEANQRYAGSVTATEIDRLQLLIDQAELSVEQAEHELQVAAASAEEKRAVCRVNQLRVDQHEVRAPIEGSIAETLVQDGQWVEPGQPLVRIIALDPIRISCFVDGDRWDRRLVGHDVVFEFKAPQADEDELDLEQVPRDERLLRLAGKVTFVSDELNPVTLQVRLEAEVDNPEERLRPGVRGKLLISP